MKPEDFTATEKPTVLVYGDGISDDTDAIQKIMNGAHTGIYPDGKRFGDRGGAHVISRTIEL